MDFLNIDFEVIEIVGYFDVELGIFSPSVYFSSVWVEFENVIKEIPNGGEALLTIYALVGVFIHYTEVKLRKMPTL